MVSLAPAVAVRRRTMALRPGLAASWIMVALILVAVVRPSLLAPQDPNAVDLTDILGLPGGAHWLGTDQLGRDLFSRIVYGAGPALTIALGATAIALVAGSLLGLLAAAGGRLLDEVVMRLTDVLLAFPGLLAALLVVAVLGPGAVHAAVAIGLASTPGFARIARGQALSVRESGYVRAAVTLGIRRPAITARHILPNALPPLLLLAVAQIGSTIIAGAALSYLGLGAQPPTAEWGSMLSDGRDYLQIAWPIAVFPGLAITATVIAFNTVGGDLRRRFDRRDRDAGY